MMVRRSGRYTVNWRGFRDFVSNKAPDDGELFAKRRVNKLNLKTDMKQNITQT